MLRILGNFLACFCVVVVIVELLAVGTLFSGGTLDADPLSHWTAVLVGLDEPADVPANAYEHGPTRVAPVRVEEMSLTRSLDGAPSGHLKQLLEQMQSRSQATSHTDSEQQRDATHRLRTQLLVLLEQGNDREATRLFDSLLPAQRLEILKQVRTLGSGLSDRRNSDSAESR